MEKMNVENLTVAQLYYIETVTATKLIFFFNTQMEALQKIKVFRVFDVFSLLACLQNLRSTGLQKVRFYI